MHSGLKEECGQQIEGSYYVLPLSTGEAASGILCCLLGFQFERNLEKLEQVQGHIRSKESLRKLF